jgi:hypothetical protein
MAPIVESVHAPGESLAAIHVTRGILPETEACYRCHSGYGLSGGFTAKLRGMEHMVRAAVGAVRYPLRLYEAYDVRQCLGCHAQTIRFRTVEAHQSLPLQQALITGSLGCTGSCHPPAHPEDTLNPEPGSP